jgi:hypothetical protein
VPKEYAYTIHNNGRIGCSMNCTDLGNHSTSCVTAECNKLPDVETKYLMRLVNQPTDYLPERFDVDGFKGLRCKIVADINKP